MPQKGDSFVFSPFKVNRVLWYYSTILKLSECLILIFQLYRICRLKSMKEKKRKIVMESERLKGVTGYGR